jgi:hexosaminidase
MSEIAILPIPVSAIQRDGAFIFDRSSRILSSETALDIAKIFSSWIEQSTGVRLPISNEKSSKSIQFELSDSLASLGPEGYRLSVTEAEINLQAFTKSGLLYAAQTLRQLLPPEVFSIQRIEFSGWEVPCIEITDQPRFGWRGAMLDVARHFMPLEFIYKFIDLLALHKLNSFHWHLTEDQGWRIEIKKYPRLNEIGSWRDETMVGHYRGNKDTPIYDGIRHGGFYTQEEAKQVVEYAARLGVNVVPEIEMPGHAQAAIASYPELGNTGAPIEVSKGWGIHENVYNVEETTFAFLQNVLDEVLTIFPSKFIHIGGDEVPKKEWRESPRVQAKMKELGLQNEDELQSYFIRRMDQFLTSKNRRLIGWDEILEGGLAPNATVMSWRGEAGGIAAAQAGHDVVMAPNTYTYFDYYQVAERENEPLAIGGFLPLDVVYSYDPIPADITPQNVHHILGTQAQIWTEYIPEPSKVEFMAFPRLCALAEVAWSPKDKKDSVDFSKRLNQHLMRLDHLKVNYRKP